MPHPLVDVGDPQPRQVIVGVGRRNLLKRGQRLGTPSFLRKLNGGREVRRDVIDWLRDVLCEQQKKKGKQHTCGFGCYPPSP